jgi:hypothetical protein
MLLGYHKKIENFLPISTILRGYKIVIDFSLQCMTLNLALNRSVGLTDL